HGSLDIIKYLVGNGVDVHKNNVLLLASKHGHLGILSHFIKNGGNNLDDLFKSASQKGNLKTVKYLLDNGVDISTAGAEALRLASISGNLEVVKYLIENGADIYINRFVKYLIEKGADIGKGGNDSLRAASENGNFDIVKYLVENGPGLDLYEALEEAETYSRFKIIKFLKKVKTPKGNV
ncbi:hypothetical protein BB558_006579, partial [Smittium angustum]